jgi:phage portal protein BeeE
VGNWLTGAQRVRETAAAVNAATCDTEPAPRVRGAGPFGWTELGEVAALYAMQVPAISRGVRLISGTVAQLPIVEWAPAGAVPNPFLERIEPDRAPWVTKQRLVRDMVLGGRGYVQVTQVNAAGLPMVGRYILPSKVSYTPGARVLTIDGIEYPVSNPATPGTTRGAVIVIDGFSDGILTTGVDTIETALALEDASRMYARTPRPTQTLRNVSGYELSDDEIDKDIALYERTRREHSVAYLNNGYELGDGVGWNATEIALVEQRNQSALNVARLLNLDPLWLGAGVPSSSLSYVNRLDLRQDLIDFTLSDYIVPIEQRFSLPDVMTPGNRARFETSDFLRANLDARATVAIGLVGAGIVTPEEAKAYVSDRPTGGIA